MYGLNGHFGFPIFEEIKNNEEDIIEDIISDY